MAGLLCPASLRPGTAAFGGLLRHPVTAGVPFVVKTPGGEGGHAKDVDTLRRLRDCP